jgi:hypothetical protein
MQFQSDLLHHPHHPSNPHVQDYPQYYEDDQSQGSTESHMQYGRNRQDPGAYGMNGEVDGYDYKRHLMSDQGYVSGKDGALEFDDELEASLAHE